MIDLQTRLADYLTAQGLKVRLIRSNGENKQKPRRASLRQQSNLQDIKLLNMVIALFLSLIEVSMVLFSA